MEAYVKVTGAGSITIPAYLRRELHIETRDAYKLEVHGADLTLTRCVDKCDFCGSDEFHTKLGKLCGKWICPNCRKKVEKEVARYE